MVDTFGPFELARLIGAGGMAEVFIAHRRDDPSCAPLVVKRIRPDLASDQEYLKRLVLEAQVASRVSHPNLVRFHEFGRIGDCHYIVLDYIDGYNLNRIVKHMFDTGQRPPIQVAVHLAKGLLNALATMHSVHDDDGRPRPMLHRDVTPSNVIVSRSGQPVLIDFGITKDMLGPAITLPGKVIGTTRYMSPEHRRAEYIDSRSDVFSASIIFWELLTGAPPWPPLDPMKELLRTTFDPPHVPPELLRHIPRDVLEVVFLGLECDTARRFTSAVQMSQALALCSISEEVDSLGVEATRRWIHSTGVVPDAELDQPVVDFRPVSVPEFWTPKGRIASDIVKIPPPEEQVTEFHVLDVPPLPPPREDALTMHDDKLMLRAALGKPMWVIVLVIGFVILLGGVATIFVSRS